MPDLHLLQVGHAAVGVRGVAFPLLVEADPAILEPTGSTAAVTGDDLAAVAHHAVGELKDAIGRAGAGQGASPDVTARELAPHHIAVLVIAGHRGPGRVLAAGPEGPGVII